MTCLSAIRSKAMAMIMHIRVRVLLVCLVVSNVKHVTRIVNYTNLNHTVKKL